MALTNAFEKAVLKGNVRDIRIMLKDSLLVDPSFERFKEMEKVAKSVDGLYDSHDGRSFVENPDDWDDSYMDKIMVQVVGNFSHERVEHLMNVVRKLRPVQDKRKTTERPRLSSGQNTGPYQKQKKNDQSNGNYLGTKITGGAVVGGIAGGVVGVLASLIGVVAGCVGVGAAGGAVGGILGAVVIYCSSERK